MRKVTGSPWIGDFRCWTWQRSRFLVLTKRSAASGDENDERPELSIPAAGQKDRRLLGREWQWWTMVRKSQLCACSFQDSLRQKNWALGQISKFPDTIGYVRVDGWKRFEYAACWRENFGIRKKIPDTCGHGLSWETGPRPLGVFCEEVNRQWSVVAWEHNP